MGGTLKFALESDVATLDPTKALAQPADKVIANGIYDPLMTFDDTGKVVPNLATNLSPSTDLKTWTITLPTGIMFTDGTPFNADAVVAQFKHYKDPATNCTCQADVAHIVSTTKTDDTHVVFQLDGAQVAFDALLAGTLGYMESPTAVATEGANYPKKPVGTGAFKLTEFVPGDHFTLVKNPTYWKKDKQGNQLPYLDSIIFKPIPDTKVRLQALQNGDVDMIQTADSATVKQAVNAGLQVQKVSGSSSTIILLNNTAPPFDDVNIRRAASYAIDKQFINQVVYGGIRQVSASAFATSSPFYKNVGDPAFDLNKAKALVAAYGKPVVVTAECIPTPEAIQILQIVQQQWQAAGMKVTFKTEEQGAYVNDIFGHKPYQAACFRSNQFPDPDQLYTSLHSKSNLNLINYTNPQTDKDLETGRTSGDLATRKAAYDDLQVQLANDVPSISLLYDLYGNIATKKVHGIPTPEADSLGAISPDTFWLSK
jgi:peptide/nickel transport system substrate-binding protein